MEVGKEKGFVLYDEMNDLLTDFPPGREFEDLLSDLDSAGVFNLFMPVRYLDDENGTFSFHRPSCEKGDYIDFRAEMDVLVAATSCPEDNIVNDFDPKGMLYRIFE